MAWRGVTTTAVSLIFRVGELAGVLAEGKLADAGRVPVGTALLVFRGREGGRGIP